MGLAVEFFIKSLWCESRIISGAKKKWKTHQKEDIKMRGLTRNAILD